MIGHKGCIVVAPTQDHAAVLAAHLDLLAVVEQHLVVRGLVARLEDEQLPLLPWAAAAWCCSNVALMCSSHSARSRPYQASCPLQIKYSTQPSE